MLEPGLQEPAQPGRGAELWDLIEFLERIGKAPNCPRFEFLLLWLELKFMDVSEALSWAVVRLRAAAIFAGILQSSNKLICQ